MEIHKVSVDVIDVGQRLRSVDPERVSVIAESIKAIGLQTPISVWADDEGCEVRLVAGAHRLAAVKELGWEDVDCVLVNMDEIDRQLWEIAENLHRAELTTLQRSEHIAEWVRLMEEKRKAAQVAPVSSKGGRGNEGGINAASRDLGIERTKVQRAVKIAERLTPEAKALAVEYGYDDNQSALERIVRAGDDAEAQREEVERIEDERVAREQRGRREPTPAQSADWSEENEASFVQIIDLLEASDSRVRAAVADYLLGQRVVGQR